MTMIQFPTEFRDFLRSLNLQGVDYLVVGGYAVAFHGHPRTTGDLDIWISITTQNITRVRTALRDFGFEEGQVASAPLHLPGRVIRMGSPPLRIEVLTSVSGVEFDECQARQKLLQVEGLDVPFLSREDLLANKRAAGRSQDIADIDALSRTNKPC